MANENKIAILGDLHWGARSDSIHIINHFNNFFSKVFFPELDRRGITKVIQCGDLVDRRKFININTAHAIHEYFTKEIEKRNISLDIVIGNHDTFYKGTNSVNTLNILYRNAPDNIKYYSSPAEVIIHDKRFLYVPWICDDNEQLSYEYIHNSKSDYMIGHLELSGFEMNKDNFSEEGMSHRILSKFKQVFTGHYHHKSTIDNITYVGTPYEIVWSDYDDPRGFIILDLDTGETEFVQNHYSLFHRIIYDEKIINNATFPYEKYKNTYVKIAVVSNKKKHKLDEFLDNFNKVETIDLQVIDESVLLDTDVNVDMEQIEDTYTIINNYVDKIEIEDKSLVKQELINLYNEAIQLNKE